MAIFVYGGTLGDDGGYTKTGYALRDIKGSIKKLEKSDKIQNHILKFPKDKSLMDIDWLGIIGKFGVFKSACQYQSINQKLNTTTLSKCLLSGSGFSFGSSQSLLKAQNHKKCSL